MIILYFYTVNRSRDSSFGIAMGYGLDDQGSIHVRGKRFFFSSRHPDQLWGPSSLLASGYWGLSLGVKPGCEADHSPPSSAEVKNGGAISSFPDFMEWCLKTGTTLPFTFSLMKGLFFLFLQLDFVLFQQNHVCRTAAVFPKME
jgi:hypothetical protein